MFSSGSIVQLFSECYSCVCWHLGLSANLISRQVDFDVYIFVIKLKFL